LLALLASAATAWAQPAYPTRAIRIVVPYAPGGGTDTTARVLGQKLTDAWGPPVVIDNRPGAAGIIGTEIVAKAAPDGYTLIVVAGAHAINPSLYAKLPYDTGRAFEPVSLLVSAPNVLAVHPSIPARSTKELVALARARPGQLTFGSGGAGQVPHLAGELFKLIAGVDMVHVPYKGGAPATADVIGGQLSMIFGGMVLTFPHVQSGKLRALGTTGARRARAMADLPTLAEAGLPGFEAAEWFGLFAPAGTPRPVIDRVNAETARILAQPDVHDRLASLGAEIAGGPPDQLAMHVRSEMSRWAKVVQAAKLRAN